MGGLEVPLLIWKMNLRIRLTSAKDGVLVEVEAEAELGKKRNVFALKFVLGHLKHFYHKHPFIHCVDI